MSRSTGTFPRYTKLEISPNDWPKNYYNSCRYCEVCEFNWPASHLFIDCPFCGERTDIDDANPPDIRWPDAINHLLNARFEKFYEKYNEDLTDEQLIWEDKIEDFDFKALDSELEIRSKAA